MNRLAILPSILPPLLALLAVGGCTILGDSNADLTAAVGPGDTAKAERLHRRGVFLLKQGKIDKAQAAFHNALIADQSFGPALNNMGLLYYDAGDLYSAAWSFERALAALPDRPEPANNLGMTLEAAGRLDEAVEMYQTARGMDSTNPEFLGNLIRTRLRRGDVDYSLYEDLQELIYIETRPDWRAFAQQQLTMMMRVTSEGPTDLSADQAAGSGAARDVETLPDPPLTPLR